MRYALFAAALMLGACRADLVEEDTSLENVTLETTNWRLTAISTPEGEVALSDRFFAPWLVLTQQARGTNRYLFEAFTSCNHLFGAYSANTTGSLRFPEVPVTGGFCSLETDRIELAYVYALMEARAYELKDTGLQISGAGYSLSFRKVSLLEPECRRCR